MSNVGDPDAQVRADLLRAAPMPHRRGLLRAAPVRRRRRLIPALVLCTIVASLTVGAALWRFGADVASLGAGMSALGFLLAIVHLPMNVEAWRLGSDGQSLTSLALQPLIKAGFVVLRDRRIPGSRARIDHLAIGPTGVWVIETKSWRGRLRIRGEDLTLDGRRAPAVERAVRTASAIRSAAHVELGALGVTVRSVLCFHHVRLPWFRREIRGVAVVDGKRLARLLASSPPLIDQDAVERIAEILDRAVPLQVRAAGK